MVTGGYRKAADLPRVIPVFPLNGALLLPYGQLPLNVFEPRYLNMVDDAMAGDRIIGMIQTRAGGVADLPPPLAPIGCAGRITSFAETPDGRYLITLSGLCRFAAGDELPVRTPYRQVIADFHGFAGDLRPMVEDEGFDRIRFLSALKAYLDRRALDLDWEAAKTAPGDALVNSLAMALPFEPAEKQALLEARGLRDRRQALIALMEIDAAGLAGEDDPPPLQ
ncbi:peptidase S16 [Caulobacter sp. CCUG 60055]|uniref:LON peptidase substrate-binding domain-containing protein n=1 Tax=Caulobacter sp. CCUG 60055 TaxID=2100090 RepID=UPI001FA7B10A|nr:LON peptidase substrate-binding domain-containing protein [Caulobacter sp. CCUG 60055]MBQ1543290.1 LON peptidase substrate-binding domain-containing protein [Caulobacteraceae bacterium]MCI3179812.1 peptidase S16 [Caulobacter sp. CCUG 60055]